MDKKYLGMNLDNADKICARIKEDSESMVLTILDNGNAQRKVILETGQREAGKLEAGIFKELDNELEKAKQKIFSLVSLEKKRLVLEEKNRFVEDVIKRVNNIADGFRRDARYGDFLLQGIVEGAGIINQAEIDVLYSFLDEAIITKAFEENAKKTCDDKFKKNFSIQFKKTEFFKDIGIIVQTRNGSILYDNRFSMRLKRKSEELSAALVKEML
jgi:vacuolar-type H+-ATPase subunit E/Vma4